MLFTCRLLDFMLKDLPVQCNLAAKEELRTGVD